MGRLCIVLTLLVLVVIIIELITNFFELNGLAIFLLVILLLIGIIGSLTIVQNAVSLTISEDKIVVVNLITGRSIILQWEDFNEFYIDIQFERYGGFQFSLVLGNHNNFLQPISLDYIENVHEVISELEKRLVNLTKDEFGILKSIEKVD